MNKVILIICDGMGDLPVPSFGNKTPLEAAKKPAIDALSKLGSTGIMYVLGKGVRPNSDEAHLTLFGYNLTTDYPGRGPIEAAGLGIRLEHGDVAIRANLATVDDNLRVIDRRAGRIDDTSGFVKELDGMEIDGVKFIVKPGTGHRVIIVMRGEGLSDKISNSDVHYVTDTEIVEDWEGKKVNTVRPLDETSEAKHAAETLQKFLEKAHAILEKNPMNAERVRRGEPKGNYFLTRGPGYYKKLKTFEEMYSLKSACIAGAGLYKGLGAMAGMDLVHVEGATGLPNTNVQAKIQAAIDNMPKYDFIFVHIKPTDIFGENGDCEGKKAFIEKIDSAVALLSNTDAVVALTADHSTPCSHKDHSADPVPLLIYKKGMTGDGMEFGETNCMKGSLGEIQGTEFMKKLLSFR